MRTPVDPQRSVVLAPLAAADRNASRAHVSAPLTFRAAERPGEPRSGAMGLPRAKQRLHWQEIPRDKSYGLIVDEQQKGAIQAALGQAGFFFGPPPPSRLTTLPAELLRLVGLHLEPKDILRLRQTGTLGAQTAARSLSAGVAGHFVHVLLPCYFGKRVKNARQDVKPDGTVPGDPFNLFRSSIGACTYVTATRQVVFVSELLQFLHQETAGSKRIEWLELECADSGKTSLARCLAGTNTRMLLPNLLRSVAVVQLRRAKLEPKDVLALQTAGGATQMFSRLTLRSLNNKRLTDLETISSVPKLFEVVIGSSASASEDLLNEFFEDPSDRLSNDDILNSHDIGNYHFGKVKLAFLLLCMRHPFVSRVTIEVKLPALGPVSGEGQPSNVPLEPSGIIARNIQLIANVVQLVQRPNRKIKVCLALLEERHSDYAARLVPSILLYVAALNMPHILIAQLRQDECRDRPSAGKLETWLADSRADQLANRTRLSTVVW